MTPVKFEMKKGLRFTYDDVNYIATSPATFRALRVGKTAVAAQERPKPQQPQEEQEQEAQGNHQSDNAQAVDKNEVLSIINKEIDRLEKQENDILLSSIDEVEDVFEENRVEVHLSTASQIMNLKKILNKVKKL